MFYEIEGSAGCGTIRRRGRDARGVGRIRWCCRRRSGADAVTGSVARTVGVARTGGLACTVRCTDRFTGAGSVTGNVAAAGTEDEH